MAGFNPYGEATIDFSGTRYKGAEVNVRIDFEPDELEALFYGMDEGRPEAPKGPIDQVDPKEMQAWSKATREHEKVILGQFAEKALVSWNLTGKDGNPLPATVEGMSKAPLPLARRIYREWQDAVWNPTTPLSADTPGGSPAGPE